MWHIRNQPGTEGSFPFHQVNKTHLSTWLESFCPSNHSLEGMRYSKKLFLESRILCHILWGFPLSQDSSSLLDSRNKSLRSQVSTVLIGIWLVKLMMNCSYSLSNTLNNYFSQFQKLKYHLSISKVILKPQGMHNQLDKWCMMLHSHSNNIQSHTGLEKKMQGLGKQSQVGRILWSSSHCSYIFLQASIGLLGRWVHRQSLMGKLCKRLSQQLST